MKKFICLLSIVMMAFASVVLSSCGNDDDEENNNEITLKMTAVHKIKITLTGDTDNFNCSALFKGMTWQNNKAEIAEIFDDNGKVLMGQVENFTSLTGNTNKYGTTLVVAVLISDNKPGNTGEVIIKFEGYIDGKITNTQSYTIKGSEEKYHSFTFSTIAR